MKLLKHYVSDVHQMKVWPIAGLICRLRRQPNTCANKYKLKLGVCRMEESGGEGREQDELWVVRVT